ncbi:MAG: YihY/virulence factor BrkB family protein [Anaerolineae bacterium]|jgi:membrane protein
MIFRTIFNQLKETAVGFSQGNGSTLAAAIAYRALFSMAPLLVIAVAVAGRVFGEKAVAGELVAQIQGVVGQETAVLIQNLLSSASQGSSGTIATIISVIVLFFGASGLFSEIKVALDQIWDVAPPPTENSWQGVIQTVKSKLLAFLLVVLIGVLLLVMLAVSTALSALGTYLSGWWSGGLLPVLNNVVLIAITAVLFAIIFRTLPDAEIAWRDVALGALVTAVFFGLGEYLIGLYLTRTSVGSTYGAAGSLVAALLWVYYSAQIFLFGAEFTQVYANKYGSRLLSDAEETAVTDPE